MFCSVYNTIMARIIMMIFFSSHFIVTAFFNNTLEETPSGLIRKCRNCGNVVFVKSEIVFFELCIHKITHTQPHIHMRTTGGEGGIGCSAPLRDDSAPSPLGNLVFE